MRTYYHCLDGNHIPLFEIKNDLILVECPNTKVKEKMTISDYCNEYMETCYSCGGWPLFFYQNKFYCKDCTPNSKIGYNFMYNNFHCPLHYEYYNYYCKNCDKNLCNECIFDHKNHQLMPDEKTINKNKILKRFITAVSKKILELKKIIDGMEKELDLYTSIYFENDNVIIKEKILNLENLKIFENIEEKEKIFVEKINDLINELNFFKNFENTNKNRTEKNSINIEGNYRQSFTKEINVNNNITYEFNNNINNLSKSMNNINNPKMNRENSEMFSNEISSLIEVNSIQLENIENKNKYIQNKIIDISNKFEDCNKLKERDLFLFSVSNIARKAHSYSYELAELLIKKFNEKNTLSSIIYEKAKVELSSWVNQSLIILNDNNDIRDIRKFYDFHCKNEIKRIADSIKIEEKIKIFYNESSFTFQKLFRNLSQLYTEVLFYSGKNIEIKYIENCQYKYEYMKDINDKKFGRNVQCTILPGLFVNNEAINNGKILVYCEKSKKDGIPKFNPMKKELEIKNTIKTVNIISVIKCDIFVEEEKNSNSSHYIIIIVTDPKIPEKDHPKFSIKQNNGREIESKESNIFEIKKTKIKYNTIIYGTVEINGIIIETKNSITLGKKKIKNVFY